MPPREIVIDGTDCAGKTPLIECLVPLLARQFVVAVHAPYRVEEVFSLWDSAPREAARIVTGHMQAFRAAHDAADVIVWDRGWPTAWVSTTDAAARDRFLPFPALTVLLLNTIATTEQKARAHGLAGAWVVDRELRARFNAAYHALDPGPEAALERFTADAAGRFDLPSVSERIVARYRAIVRPADARRL